MHYSRNFESMTKFFTVLSFAFTLFSSTLSAQEAIQWMTVEEAQEAIKKEPRKIMIDVYTHWCGPCKMMMNSTFKTPGIIKYINENYYAVKFDAEGPDPVVFKGHTFENKNYDPNRRGRNGTHDFTYGIANVNGRVAYPTLVFLNESLDIITPIQGYLKANQLEPILHFVVDEEYIDGNWETYQQNFKSEL